MDDSDDSRGAMWSGRFDTAPDAVPFEFGVSFPFDRRLFEDDVAGSLAWAIGFELGETKEQLKLEYDVSTTDHGTGRVTVQLTLIDEGRLKPLTRGVELAIPSKDGTGHFDLAVPLASRTVDGKPVYFVHLKKELARRADIRLQSGTLDGRNDPLTWYYHTIPLAKYLE